MHQRSTCLLSKGKPASRMDSNNIQVMCLFQTLGSVQNALFTKKAFDVFSPWKVKIVDSFQRSLAFSLAHSAEGWTGKHFWQAFEHAELGGESGVTRFAHVGGDWLRWAPIGTCQNEHILMVGDQHGMVILWWAPERCAMNERSRKYQTEQTRKSNRKLGFWDNI